VLKSPWMLLAVVPGGFLLLAAAAAFGPAQSVAAAEAFAGLAALALVTGGLLTFTFARRPAVPTLAALRRFARDWISDHPGAAEAEARAALARWFGGSTGVADWEYAVGATPPSGNPGDALVGAGISALVLGLWHRFFPVAPARPEDIEAVLGELRGEGVFGQG
jgi:hypothetical protein